MRGLKLLLEFTLAGHVLQDMLCLGYGNYFIAPLFRVALMMTYNKTLFYHKATNFHMHSLTSP